jgi:glucose-1-phosphate thymidylyltransferase
LRELNALWLERERQDEYFGTLVNAWLAQGGEAHARRAGTSYVDVGTVRGYREAMALLSGDDDLNTARLAAAAAAAQRAADRDAPSRGSTVPVIASPLLPK